MRRRGLPGEVVLWVPVGLIPILNGALRMLVYARWLGEPRASMLSSVLDVLVVGAYACFAQRRWPVETRGGSVGRGLLWISMTTSSHFGLGAFVFGVSLPALVSKYDLFGGETWALVSLAIFGAPVFGRWRVAAQANREASASRPPAGPRAPGRAG